MPAVVVMVKQYAITTVSLSSSVLMRKTEKAILLLRLRRTGTTKRPSPVLAASARHYPGVRPPGNPAARSGDGVHSEARKAYVTVIINTAFHRIPPVRLEQSATRLPLHREQSSPAPLSRALPRFASQGRSISSEYPLCNGEMLHGRQANQRENQFACLRINDGVSKSSSSKIKSSSPGLCPLARGAGGTAAEGLRR